MKGAVMDKHADFFENVAVIIEQARAYVGRTADLTMCVTNFEIGRMIVEREQDGKARAEYGRKLLAELSAYLRERVGKGFSESTLRNARQFYQIYAPTIQQSMIAESKTEKRQTLSAKSETRKSQTLSSVFTGKKSSLNHNIAELFKEFEDARIVQQTVAQLQWCSPVMKRKVL